MISNVNMLCRRMRVDGCGRSFIYVVYLRFNGYTKGCFTYHCRVYAVSRISKNIKFVWNLRLLIIYSCIILRNHILGTLQQHSNTLLITKSKMYIGVRQIQVGKRIVLSKNKHLNKKILQKGYPQYFHIVLSTLGWITGHTYVTYGPLLNGATSVIFEGIPFYPSNDRCWQIVQKYKVSYLRNQ